MKKDFSDRPPILMTASQFAQDGGLWAAHPKGWDVLQTFALCESKQEALEKGRESIQQAWPGREVFIDEAEWREALGPRGNLCLVPEEQAELDAAWTPLFFADNREPVEGPGRLAEDDLGRLFWKAEFSGPLPEDSAARAAKIAAFDSEHPWRMVGIA